MLQSDDENDRRFALEQEAFGATGESLAQNESQLNTSSGHEKSGEGLQFPWIARAHYLLRRSTNNEARSRKQQTECGPDRTSKRRDDSPGTGSSDETEHILKKYKRRNKEGQMEEKAKTPTRKCFLYMHTQMKEEHGTSREAYLTVRKSFEMPDPNPETDDETDDQFVQEVPHTFEDADFEDMVVVNTTVKPTNTTMENIMQLIEAAGDM